MDVWGTWDGGEMMMPKQEQPQTPGYICIIGAYIYKYQDIYYGENKI